MKKRKFSRDVAVQIMYQLIMRDTSDYAKLLSHYTELCESGEYDKIHRTFMDDFKPNPNMDVVRKIDNEYVRATEPDQSYLQRLFESYAVHTEVVDEAIKSNLHGWNFSRIPAMDRAILKVALTEILFMEDIPYKSSVNEAVEIAKRYGDEKSSGFINGLLAKYGKGMTQQMPADEEVRIESNTEK